MRINKMVCIFLMLISVSSPLRSVSFALGSEVYAKCAKGPTAKINLGDGFAFFYRVVDSSGNIFYKVKSGFSSKVDSILNKFSKLDKDIPFANTFVNPINHWTSWTQQVGGVLENFQFALNDENSIGKVEIRFSVSDSWQTAYPVCVRFK